jgi:hypothetical protein
MKRTVILRFRDLVTEPGGTIAEHRRILRQEGSVWWGWWMKQWENAPRGFLAEILEEIEATGPVQGYLFNTGLDLLYSCDIADIRTGLDDAHPISTPDPNKTPDYYHRGRYPAWFLLTQVEDRSFESVHLQYESFPTVVGGREMRKEIERYLKQDVTSLEQLRGRDVTMWVVTATE